MLKLYLISFLIYLIFFVVYKILIEFVVDEEKMNERIKKIEAITKPREKEKKVNWFYIIIAISLVPILRLLVIITLFEITFMSDKRFERLLEILKRE